MATAYKIRKFQNGKNSKGEPFINYSLTIPSRVAEQLPTDMRFACEMTEEGLLFRPVDENENIKLPKWAAQNGNGKKSPRSRPKS